MSVNVLAKFPRANHTILSQVLVKDKTAPESRGGFHFLAGFFEIAA